MNVVDSSGWLEYFGKGTNAGFFAPAIKNTDAFYVPTVCIYEVFKRLLSQRGEEAARKAIGVMSHGTIVDLTREIAVNAAAISTRYKIAMTDSIILATARSHGARLWTQDIDFAVMDGVAYVEKCG